jgi:hypothetical protein
MNDFQYLPKEGVWRSLPNPDSGFEILIAGDSTEPNSAHMAFLEDLLPYLETVRLRAIAYLTVFVNSALKPDWYFEALYITEDFATEFQLSFSLESDIYGDWRVGFYTINQHFEPDFFSRTQT